MSEAMKPCPVADELERMANELLQSPQPTEAEDFRDIGAAFAYRNAATLIRGANAATAREVEELRAEVERLRGALGLADAALRGANMNMAVVERKISAALASKGEAA